MKIYNQKEVDILIEQARKEGFEMGSDVRFKLDEEFFRKEVLWEEKDSPTSKVIANLKQNAQSLLLKELIEEIEKMPQDFCNDGFYSDGAMILCLSGVLKARNEKIMALLHSRLKVVEDSKQIK